MATKAHDAPTFSMMPQRRGTPAKLQPLRKSLAPVGSTATLVESRHPYMDSISTWFDELTPDAYSSLRQMGFPDDRIKHARRYLADAPHTFDNVLQALFEIGTVSPPISRPTSAIQLDHRSSSLHEESLTQMGFSLAQVRHATRTLGECSLERALEELLAAEDPVVDDAGVNVAIPDFPNVSSISEDTVEQIMSAADGTEHAKLCGDSCDDLETLVRTIASKREDLSTSVVRHYLLLIKAGLKQNLLSSETQTELHYELKSGSLDIVREFLSLAEVRYAAGISLEDESKPWECQICFTHQDTCGWQCPSERHQFCHECMRRHVDAVAYPTCPFVGCKFKLEEPDFIALECTSRRLQAFRDGILYNAVNSLGGGADLEPDVVIHCEGSKCANAVVVPSTAQRSCFACPCGSQPICTNCRSAYHFHADCQQVQPLREVWLHWITQGRAAHLKECAANINYNRDLQHFQGSVNAWHSVVKAMRDGIDRQKELNQDEIWKSQHCRLCPGCNRPLEKIAGCNSMICGRDAHGGNEQRGCGTKFDWSEAAPYRPSLQTRLNGDLPDAPKTPRRNFSGRGLGVFHPFTDCNLCGREGKGIAGLQFRCIHCENFIVCEGCELRLPEIHNAEHVFEIKYESDFDWSHIRFPDGTPVRIVRSKNGLPKAEPQMEGELEGMTGIIMRSTQLVRGSLKHRIAMSRGFQDLENLTYDYDIVFGSFVGRVSSEFVEPLISSRVEADTLLANKVQHSSVLTDALKQL